MQPSTSVLLQNTKRLAPDKRFMKLSARFLALEPSTYLFQKKACQFLLTITEPQTITGVHHPDQRIRLFKIIPPVRPERLLAPDIPWPMSVIRLARVF